MLFKLLPLCWVLEWVSEIVCGSFKSRGPADFQSQTRRLIFLVSIFKVGGSASCGAWNPHSSRRSPVPVIFLLLVGCLPRNLVPSKPVSVPLLPFSMWLFLHNFSFEIAVPIVFRLLLGSSLMCLWEGMSSASSYSFIPPCPGMCFLFLNGFIFADMDTSIYLNQ